MKKLNWIPFLIFGAFTIKAQSLSPATVSSSGGYYANSSGQLSGTLGEMSMVETFSTTNTILTQGFQQPFDFATFIRNNEKSPLSLTVFPNPGNGNFNLAVNSKETIHGDIIIYNAIGKMIYTSIGNTYKTGQPAIPFNISNCDEGVYLLEFISENATNNKQQHSFQKIQVIK